MRPHPRVRKSVKWAGAAASVLFLVVWMATGWWCVHRTSTADRYRVGLGGGCVWVVHRPDMVSEIPPTYSLERIGRSARLELARLLFSWPKVRWSGKVRYASIPLWLPTLPLLLTTGAAWRLDTLARRRLRAGARCPTCNYDLTGLPTTTACPECGAAPAHSPHRGERT